ncbi:MAG: hypothetical protein ACK5O2_16395 [Microthrixaceae bacterium]
MAPIDPADEQRHVADPEIELWNESYYLDWFTEDATLGGYIRIGFYPNLDRVWYWACLVGERRPLVTVVEHDVAMPTSASSLELRHDGLWADHAIESPNEHMSTNLEAFGLVIEDPAEMYRADAPRGDRVPFGFELDWETDRGGYQWPPVTPRYEIPCRVHGFVQVGDERIEVDAWGQRDHSWGAARDWWSMPWIWSAGRLDDGTRFHSAGGFFADNDWGVGYRLDPASSEFAESDRILQSTIEGRERLPESSTLAHTALELTATPVAFSPVGLFHPTDGRLDRFPRALTRYANADGRTGAGWIEWNQPPEATAN